jgi:hypothetical protein
MIIIIIIIIIIAIVIVVNCLQHHANDFIITLMMETVHALKRWPTFVRVHGAIFQKYVIFILVLADMRTLNHIEKKFPEMFQDRL